jgi:hypothetical protein
MLAFSNLKVKYIMDTNLTKSKFPYMNSASKSVLRLVNLEQETMNKAE